tara:strand:+ start:426 stop:1016 length:591 start_codon:yes stop_codon:yes gene_type:complete
MFTGIIQDIGFLNSYNEGVYKIITQLNLTDCNEGSSISCNGVCLTAKNIKKNNDNTFSFEVNIGEETLLRTNLGKSTIKNKKINIEKSLKIGDEIGGHFVYGHVDSTTTINKIITLENSWEYHFKKDFRENNKFIVEKGSIAINGISLTIALVTDNSFMVSVIDHTFNNTNLNSSKVNDHVNIEYDYLSRFVLKNE